MTNQENLNGGEDVQDRKQSKKHDSGAADLEKVTDFEQESELSKDFISSAVNLFADKRTKENEEKLAKEEELQKIQVKREHIELIMSELEVSNIVAEKALRENKGDVVLALTQLIK